MHGESIIDQKLILNRDRMKDMRLKVYTHMLQTRGWKYRSFLRYLRVFKYIAFAPVRGEFLESYYVLMRYLDDIVDGDAKLPKNYKDESTYLKDKIEFSNLPVDPKDEVDYLMLHCFELAKKFNEDFQSETKDILESLWFDAKRRNKLIVFGEKELMHHFHKLDVRGTIQATLKIFKEDPTKYDILEPLGMATRCQFDLEDFEADIAAGYVNVTKEECAEFNITQEDLHNISAPSIKKWFQYKAQYGMALLKEHRRRLPEGQFKLLTRATFPLVYELPAKKVFQGILKSK